MRLVKTAVFCCVIFFVFIGTTRGMDGRGLIGVAGIDSDTPRASGFSVMVENHILETSRGGEIFDPIPAGRIKRELERFDCVSEICLLEFARRAGISVLVTGNVRDFGSYMKLELSGFGTLEPFHGRKLFMYNARIPVPADSGPREMSLVAEEHSVRFLAGFLENFVRFLSPDETEEGVFLFSEEITGNYTVYKPSEDEPPREFIQEGTVYINKGVPESGITGFSEGRGIYIDYSDEARYLQDTYPSKKRDIVFEESTHYSAVYAGLFAVPASAAMPFAAPIMGYYNNNDWSGLTLWAINGLPYTGMQIRGFLNHRDMGKTYTGDELALSRFAWYMFLVGGLPLFTDSFAGGYLRNASDYTGRQPLMGNATTAVVLSFFGGGGGYFYRGERTLGYLSFHANNLLVYFAIRDLSPGRKYDPVADEYRKEDSNRRRGYMLAGAAVALRIIEAFHVYFMDDRILNGEVAEEHFSVTPEVIFDSYSGSTYGMRISYEF